MLTFGVLIIVLFGLYYFSDWFSKATGYVLGEDEKEKLATCLNGKNAFFYVSSTCPDCEEQLDLFGNAKDVLNVITCSSADECPEGGVPAWQIGKQIFYGVKSLEELIKISGCDLDIE
jgi:ribosomal protein S27E